MKNPPSGSRGRVKFGKASSLKHAAATLKLPVEVLKAAKAHGCPGFDDHHRCDCDLISEWLERPENRHFVEASPMVRKAVAEADIAEVDLERARFARDNEKGKFIEKQKMAERILALSAEQKRTVRQKLENEYPTAAVTLVFRELEARFSGNREVMKVLLEVQPKAIEECRQLGRDVVDQVCQSMQPLVMEWIEFFAA
jgi:hypothetical protein